MNDEYNSPETDRSYMPSIKALLAFERAATLNSFSLAAQELNRTPSAISHAIKELEAQLGLALFDRMGKSLLLTEAGVDYLSTARLVVSALRDGTHRLRRSGDKNIVRISSLPFFTSAILMPNYAAFEADNPSLELRIETTNAYADIRNNVVDLAIRYGQKQSQGLTTIPLLKVYAQPICSPSLLNGRPFTYKELQHQSLVHVAPEPDAWSEFFASIGFSNIETDRSLMFDSTLGALDAVKRGLGIGLAMSPVIQQYRGYGTDFVAAAPKCSHRNREYFIVCRPSSEGELKIERTIKWLTKSVQPFVGTT